MKADIQKRIDELIKDANLDEFYAAADKLSGQERSQFIMSKIWENPGLVGDEDSPFDNLWTMFHDETEEEFEAYMSSTGISEEEAAKMLAGWKINDRIFEYMDRSAGK